MEEMNKFLKNSSKHKILNKINKTTPDLTREIELITKAVTEKILKMEKNKEMGPGITEASFTNII